MSEIETVVIITGTHREKIAKSAFNPAIHTLLSDHLAKIAADEKAAKASKSAKPSPAKSAD